MWTESAQISHAALSKSTAWGNAAMASDTPFADPNDDDSVLRPAWADTEDETDGDRLGIARAPRPSATNRSSGPAAWLPAVDLPALLGPLCAATEGLARLDARAAAAPAAVRAGLIARMAFAEAAGWLAHAHAWVHPLDLALRALGLTAPTALAAVGAGHRALPQTFAGPAEPRDWLDPPFETMAEGERAVAEALALARLLRRPPKNTSGRIFASATEAAETLASLGAGGLDEENFSAWWSAHAPKPDVRRRRYGLRGGEGDDPPLPPLLHAAHAAQSWMEAGITEHPAPAHALFAATGLFARAGVTRAVFLPVWAAYPAAGFGDRDLLPTLRSDAADRLLGRDRPVTWPLACLHLVAESARAGLRELDRLEAAAAQGRGLTTAVDKRSRLPDACEALLRTPVLTPKALASKLGIAPQTGTALLREL
jgi:hypothetical protein